MAQDKKHVFYNWPDRRVDDGTDDLACMVCEKTDASTQKQLKWLCEPCDRLWQKRYDDMSLGAFILFREQARNYDELLTKHVKLLSTSSKK